MKCKTIGGFAVAAALMLSTALTAEAYTVRIENQTTAYTATDLSVYACYQTGAPCRKFDVASLAPGKTVSLDTNGLCPVYILYTYYEKDWASQVRHSQCISPTDDNGGTVNTTNCVKSCADSSWRMFRQDYGYVGTIKVQPK